MKKAILLLIFSFLSLLTLDSYSQSADTTWVQTYTFEEQNNPETAYDSPGRRWFQFPEDDGITYQKILMYHKLKCFEDGTAGDLGFPCGEWDYLTYNYLFDHTGVIDSNALVHPLYLFDNQEFESVELIETPQFNTRRYQFTNMEISTIENESSFELGSAENNSELIFGLAGNGARSQHLYSATELDNSGLSTDEEIDAVALNINSSNAENAWLRVRFLWTSETELTDFEDNLTEVYSGLVSELSPGWQDLFLNESLVWDGESNLLLEFIVENASPDQELIISADALGSLENLSIARIKSNTSQKYAVFTENDMIKVPQEAFASVSDEVTISFWVNGFEDLQPMNGTCFEGVDEDNNRLLNTHLPWGNGRVYWDAGWDGGYDRIDKVANESDYAGRWNHWAFTKNSVSGEMKIYLNGNLWHTGQDKDNSMAGIVDFAIGAAAGWSNYYNGRLDEFRLWNEELDEATISSWMNKRVDNSHPNYEALLIQYHFNENYGEPIQSDGGLDLEAITLGSVGFDNYSSEELFFDEGEILEDVYRPQIRLFSGDFTTESTTQEFDLPLPIPPKALAEYVVSGNDVDIANVDYFWSPGTRFVYDEDDNVLESFEQTEVDLTVENDTLNYFGPPFEIIDRYELGRFITPYGIQLDMDDGWTWVYDVTDFAPLLRGEVELEAGNWQELLDLRFAFIEGEPRREVKRIEQLWAGSFGLNNFNESIEPQNIEVLEGEESFRLKVTTSGHQFSNATNCAEFCYKIHGVEVDGALEYSWQIMEECADNPLYPQGGTWIYDRAGWCPGAPVTTHNLELSDAIEGDSFEVDYTIESDPYGNYVFEGYLISYGPTQYQHDVEVEEIIAPSKERVKSRINPICNRPIIRIRNNGSETLSSCTIEYTVDGNTQSMEWTGELKFMESEEVELVFDDPSIWRGPEEELKSFEVQLSSPNGTSDEDLSNNYSVSEFYPPVLHAYEDFSDNRVIIWVTTNGVPQETSWSLYNSSGDIIYERDDFTMSSHNYRDTIPLDPGCYYFHLKDSDDDGISFWANNDGNGTVRMKKVNGGSFINFQSDFGKEIHHYFAFNIDPLSSDNIQLESPEFSLFPNPGKGLFYLQGDNIREEVDVTVYDGLGRLIHSITDHRFSEDMLMPLDLNKWDDGIYVVMVNGKRTRWSSKLIKMD